MEKMNNEQIEINDPIEVTELDDEMLEDVAGGTNSNCDPGANCNCPCGGGKELQ